MTIDTKSPRSRRAVRASAVSLGLVLGSLAAPALASPPETWQNPDNGSLLNNLLFLIGVPVLVFVILALLTYLPSMMRRQSAEPGLAFQERAEWFGGPRKGLEATSAATEAQSEKGGAGARW